tara:strand:- start:827 stop:973 length:147 start_codon:yes stop_codon:yes gene_type:complete
MGEPDQLAHFFAQIARAQRSQLRCPDQAQGAGRGWTQGARKCLTYPLG